MGASYQLTSQSLSNLQAESYVDTLVSDTNKTIGHDFQKKSWSSFRVDNRNRNKLQHESKEVRAKSLHSTQLPSDPSDFTIFIGSQAF